MSRVLRLILLLSYVSLSAEAIYWRGDYTTAHREALTLNRPLLVLLLQDRCEDCRLLVERLVDHTELSAWINRFTVPVIVRADARSDYPVELYYSTHFPTLFLTDSRREIAIDPPCHGVDACLDSLWAWKQLHP